MKHTGLLFRPAMARVNVAGIKDVTRRIVKHIPALAQPGDWCHRVGDQEFERIVGDYRRFCPYGQPGDLIYCKETIKADTEGDVCGIRYLADNAFIPIKDSAEAADAWGELWHGTKGRRDGRTIPSMFMPKAQARFWAVIVSIRVERLQDITEEDARREGVIQLPNGRHALRGEIGFDGTTARDVYRLLINSIRPGSWERNDWHWRIEYRRVTVVGGEVVAESEVGK